MNSPPQPPAPTDIQGNAFDIQGNILAGFNKDFASFLFFVLPPAQADARGWLAELVDEVATGDEVGAFNDLFKRVRARRQREVVKAAWTNIAFTFSGLQALGVPQADLDQLPAEFQQGMRARAAELGDTDANDPEGWPADLGTMPIHALMIVAADSAADRNAEVSHFVRHAALHDVSLVFQQDGITRSDAPGHEHFGFKDGISQPGIAGLTQSPIPGQDLIAPGEFVFGYPGQPPAPPPQPGQPGYPAPPPPDPANPQPPWLRNGSYLVFRRLTQDVPGFLEFVDQAATQENWSADLLGAKLVGRYRTGAPLEGANNSPTDPGIANPAALDDSVINNFEYEGPDHDGMQVPRAAHIRKAYPRDQQPPGEDEAERHRILRRGIPFGHSFSPEAAPGTPYAGDVKFPDDRGLCFVCYQRSIASQFEFIQTQWVNPSDFPEPGDGIDPIISQAQSQEMSLPGGAATPLQLARRWVTTTGGEYFLSPSISALTQFAAEPQ
jgi:Dyp-type peroxidase family